MVIYSTTYVVPLSKNAFLALVNHFIIAEPFPLIKRAVLEMLRSDQLYCRNAPEKKTHPKNK